MSNPLILKQYLGYSFTEYNNYVVFRQSFFHLIHGQDMYTIYPAQQWDLYKYSPTFALLMAPLAYLPDIAGLFIWNALNALVLMAGIRKLPIEQKKQSLLLYFVIMELMICMQNAQSNALIAGLIICAFGCMERKKLHWAALWLVLATFIKIYGAIGFSLFLLYPDKIKAALYSALWAVICFLLPLIAVPLHSLTWQYGNWAHMMSMDKSASYGLSIMGWLHSWFGMVQGKNVVMVAGLLLFFLPFVRWRLYKDGHYRLLLLAAMLVWVIIFNYKAESPTYIIAVTGAGIWFFARPANWWRLAMLGFVFVGTSLLETDLFPRALKLTYLEPLNIKALPCIILWFLALVEMMRYKRPSVNTPETAFN